MGTRNITAVMIDGEYKVAQYCQWDGYPSGQGVTVLNFLRSLKTEKSKKNFIEKCKSSVFATSEEIQKMWIECGADPNSQFVNMDVCDKMKKNHPQFDRDMGAEVLNFINKSPEGIKLDRQLYFVADSLFCEYAYVIDFDKNVLEVFRGFNQKPLKKTERFANIKLEGRDYRTEKYYPVKLWYSFDLNKLPTKKEFLKTLTEKDE